MKKLLILVFAIVITFAVASCGKDKTTDSSSQTGSNTASGVVSQTSQTSLTDTSSSVKVEGREVTFTLYNVSEYELTSVAVSKTDEEQWSENLLTGTLKQGEHTAIKITLPKDTGEQMYKMSAKDINGNEFEFIGLEFSELTDKGGNIHLATTEGGGGFASFSPFED